MSKLFRSRQFHVKLSKKESDSLSRMAKAYGITKSDLIRYLISQAKESA